MTVRRGGGSFHLRASMVGILSGGLALAAGAVVAVNAVPGDPGICNRETAGSASLAFQLADGPSLWDRLPNMGRAPELESVKEPITVVVFEGQHRSIPIVGGGGQIQPQGQDASEAPVFNDVVCVIAPSGEVLYYVDIDMSGLNLDDLAVERRDP